MFCVCEEVHHFMSVCRESVATQAYVSHQGRSVSTMTSCLISSPAYCSIEMVRIMVQGGVDGARHRKRLPGAQHQWQRPPTAWCTEAEAPTPPQEPPQSAPSGCSSSKPSKRSEIHPRGLPQHTWTPPYAPISSHMCIYLWLVDGCYLVQHRCNAALLMLADGIKRLSRSN